MDILNFRSQREHPFGPSASNATQNWTALVRCSSHSVYSQCLVLRLVCFSDGESLIYGTKHLGKGLQVKIGAPTSARRTSASTRRTLGSGTPETKALPPLGQSDSGSALPYIQHPILPCHL